MKKLITLIAIIATIATFAQAPQGFNYQATVRNSAGALVTNQNVYFKFNLMLNSATSVPVFSETHYVPTDDLGQVNLVIGSGTATTGSFSAINWGTGNYYLGIELNTGSGYVAMGTTQLLSVPYALYANSSGNAQTPTPSLASVLAVNNGANNTKIINLGDPVDPKDAVNKEYVDAQIQILLDYINNSLPTTDIDGNSYLPVTICNQTWTKSNINVSHYRNGDEIPQVTDPSQWANLTTGAWCYYNNDPINGAIYGKLYNWYAVNDPRGLAPQGWHIPSNDEWTTLSTCLGGEAVAGGKMKETGTLHWDLPNIGATNESGFKALPGGYRYNYGAPYSIGFNSYWWSSTEFDSTSSWLRTINYNNIYLGAGNHLKQFGFSVRCIKDSPQVGDNYQGGIIIHINQPGDLGYIPGQIHGIISSTVDQTINSTSSYYPGQTGCMWQPGTYIPSQQTSSFNVTNALGVALGTGGQNTNLILGVSQQVGLPFPAATLASQYNGGGFNDWVLPSKNELGLLYQYRNRIGGFTNAWYWSSTEKNEAYVDALDFSTGNFSDIGGYKGPSATPYKVRAIRYF
jgi:uncharacterized protein (TIGR02145 family)